MAEQLYERINEVAAVAINLASPEDIRSWSYGEVKKPETINYRTYRAERDGLFCEKIFGPEKDYECFCGKYKGIKYKGIVCERCGVKVTTSKVRRKRMGHIDLARKENECVAPVAHIWFFKATPSRISALLAMKTTDLERVLYFQDYAVTEPGQSGLEPGKVIKDEEYRDLKSRYGEGFEAGMGAEAIRKLLRRIDLEKLSADLRQELKETQSRMKGKDLVNRLKTIDALRKSGNKPEWMILEVIPVIPPDLRPLVQLESGNFATSDLNDLYRRLISRNNRLDRLIKLNAPEVIIRNEKRMLQQSADALFDNGRCRRPVLGSRNRPLKSLTDMIKGKQGRFRENLLGKRVDYSGRSVIVVEPSLKLHQCGLPKKIALELFQPFIIRRLKELGHAETIKSAKKMLERKDEEVWDILEEVTQNHPVLLNRAPTLHRMGIQAFEPVLVEGNAIKLHPLVCTGFNADFDGDQMAVHLPLSYEAQIEAHTLMLSVHNVFSPASGRPIIAPSQDMVLGIYYLTCDHRGEKGEGQRYSSPAELLMAYSYGKVGLHAKVKVVMSARMVVYNAIDKMVSGHVGRTNEDWLQDADEKGNKKWTPNLDGRAPFEAVEEYAEKHCRPFIVETTAGRVLFNDILPRGLPFFNYPLIKNGISDIIDACYKRLGRIHTLRLLDDIKEIGFKASTRGGISIAKGDLLLLKEKEQIIEATQKKVDTIELNYRHGAITDKERRNQAINEWTHAREEIGKLLIAGLAQDTRGGKPYLNPIHMMVTSGARGSGEQVRQLAGMRGLMAKPGGEIIETPIKANFREGLRVLEYFSSTHGARKGLADTALKTADSGYMTRKLADVAQHIVVKEHDCGSKNGISKAAIVKGDRTEVTLATQIVGRTSLDTIKHPSNDAFIVKSGELITPAIAKALEDARFSKIRVRSPLTCDTENGLCQQCYGADLSRGSVVELGMAAGIIAAQSIGEPGTQLTMRTFHLGGIASTQAAEKELKAAKGGKVEYGRDMEVAGPGDGRLFAMRRRGEIMIRDDKGVVLNTFPVPYGANVRVTDGQVVKDGTILCDWDPSASPILSEKAGRVRYVDLVEGRTYRDVRNAATKQSERTVIEHRGDLHPQIIVEDNAGTVLSFHPLPERALITVKDGDKVGAATVLAKTPREVGGSQDITGGLPRVTELLEARKPKDTAILAECDGLVSIAEESKRGKRSVMIRTENGEEKEHLVPKAVQLTVRSNERVRAGDAITAGAPAPQDILRILGKEHLQEFLISEVQKVYRQQNVTINDKHVEVIVAQMLSKVKVVSEGNTPFLRGTVVERYKVVRENRVIKKQGGKPATYSPLLLGITKASLSSESFLSAASFQETTKVLTHASLAGQRDTLEGLKENIILGRQIPAGTGYKTYQSQSVAHDAPPVLDDEPEITPIDEAAAIAAAAGGLEEDDAEVAV
jgi:DNA-directed RNA polymerase subunit beta'